VIVKRYVAYLQRLLVQLSCTPITIVSCCVPKDSKLWIFGAWHGAKYADNAKYLYEYVTRFHGDQILAVWLTKNKCVADHTNIIPGPVAHAYSLKGFWLSMRAGVAFVTHSLEDLNEGAFTRGLLVNLTHGTPLKRLGFDARSKRLGKATPVLDRLFPYLLPAKRRPDLICTACNLAVPRFASAYGIDRQRVVATGYPRFEALRNANSSLNSARLDRLKSAKRVLLYAPTHRKQGRGSLSLSGMGFDQGIKKWLHQTNTLLVIRAHKSLTLEEPDQANDDDRCIQYWSQDVVEDVNTLLPFVDILVTDYSSVMYDFALLQRPMVFLAPDLDEYINDDVGIYGDYDVPGPVVSTWSGVIKALEEVQTGKYNDAIEAFYRVHAEHADGHESARIVSTVSQMLKMAND
jgi:CDP-glycerol glycerophosphotransferase (TagB/SpsB family)